MYDSVDLPRIRYQTEERLKIKRLESQFHIGASLGQSLRIFRKSQHRLDNNGRSAGAVLSANPMKVATSNEWQAFEEGQVTCDKAEQANDGLHT